jgi:hypothetical protein
MNDIKQKLLADVRCDCERCNLFKEAADRIESLERSNTEMLRALRAVADSDALKVSPDLRYLARAVVGNAKVGAA